MKRNRVFSPPTKPCPRRRRRPTIYTHTHTNRMQQQHPIIDIAQRTVLPIPRPNPSDTTQGQFNNQAAGGTYQKENATTLPAHALRLIARDRSVAEKGRDNKNIYTGARARVRT